MNRVENIEQRRVEKLKEKAHTDDDSMYLALNIVVCSKALLKSSNLKLKVLYKKITSSILSLNSKFEIKS